MALFRSSAMVGRRYGLLTYATCKDKYKTKQLLQKNNINTPSGKLFDQFSSENEIILYTEQTGYPIVLKSNNGSRGVDVFPNIKNETALINAWESIRYKKSEFQFLVEKHIGGEDYKVFVVGEEAIAAYTRTPAKIIGDGEHSVKELIEIRNRKREKNPHFRVSLLEVDAVVTLLLQNEKLALDSILPKGKVVYLCSKENVSVAGDLDDITSRIPVHLKMLAVKAIKSIPHLLNGSVDIRYSKEECPEGSVLEINSMAQIAGHLFPSSGSPQDVTSKMIDFYFPESIKAKKRNSEMFFNMNTIEKHFETFPESDYTLAPAPVKETIRRMAVLRGDFTLPNIKSKIRNEARRLNLSGFIKSENSEQVEIVLSGEEGDIGLFEAVLEEGHIGVKSFEIKNYDKPITSGFYIDIDK